MASQVANGNLRSGADNLDPRGRMLSLLSVMLAGTGAVGTTSGSTSGRGSDDADPNYSDENTPRESGGPSRDSGDHEFDAGTVEAAWAAYGNAGYPAHVQPHMAGNFTAQGVPMYIQAPYPQRPVPANYSVISTRHAPVKPKRGAPKPLITPAAPQQRKNNSQQQYSMSEGIGEAAFAVAGMKRRRKRNEIGVVKRW